MAFEIKFSKFDNTPWGFRLTGGNDCGMPLTVVKVTEGSLADSFGLKDNDYIIQINEKDTTSLTHDQAHEVILQAGNNFVATVFRNGNDVAPSCPMLISTNTTPLTNGVDQVPIYDAKVTSMVYKLYPDSETTPIENSPAPCPKHVDEFQTINQLEWKKMSSKHIQSSSEYHLSSSNNQDNCIKKSNVCNGRKIEMEKTEQRSKGIESAMVIVDSTKDRSNEINTSDKTIMGKSTTIDNNEIINNNTTKNVLKTEEIKKISDETSSNKMKCETLKETITLNEAKIGAINAANSLSQQTKLNRRSSIEETRMDTVNAFKLISDNMKHKCFAVPCEASKLHTKSQTDMLLKTFFIHLTDVMVALTQMMKCEDEKICTCSCGPNCICLNKSNERSECQNVNTTEQINKTQEKTEQIIVEEKDTKKIDKLEEKSVLLVEKVSENKTEVNETNNTEVVLKEVINNIQTATGVDVTVNGKDPLEWLADLDEQQNQTSQCEVVKKVENDTILVESKMENFSSTKNSEQVIDIKENIVSDVSSTSQVKESSVKCEKLNKIQIINDISKTDTVDESTVKPSWDIKVIPTVPQTPNTDEYLFRLNVKLKGKIPDYPENEIITSEPMKEILPIKSEKISLPKKPTFSLGDVIIESSVINSNTKSETEAELDTIIESTVNNVQESFDIVNKTINETIVDNLIKEESCGDAYNKTASTNETCVIASELKDNDNNIDNTKTPVLASANNSVKVGFTNNDNIICTNVETSICYTNASISSIKNEASATNSSDSTLSSTLTSIVPVISSSICTFPASTSGNVSTISATTNNHDSLISCAIEQHGQEHETISSQFKENNIDVKNTCRNTSEEISSLISEKIETSHLEKSIEENTQIMSVSKEDLTVESAPAVQTMGELSKCYATIENNIQNLSNGIENSYNNTQHLSNGIENSYSNTENLSNGIESSYNNISDEQLMVEDIGKPGLPDQEINEILSGSAKEIKEQHVIGLQKVLASHMSRPDDEINSTDIKDMTPIVAFLKDSEVFKALNEESLKSKAETIQENRRKFTTFLQKPSRPVPFCKRIAELLTFEEPPYKVNIKKQPKKDNDCTSSILTEGVFLIPEVPILIPEPSPEYYEAPEYLADSSFPDLEDTGIPIPIKTEEKIVDVKPEEIPSENNIVSDEPIEEIECVIPNESDDLSLITNENIDSNMSMEEQLVNVQRQLVALSKLPATIQQTLDEVTKQLSKMVPGAERDIMECMVQDKPKLEEKDEIQNNNIEENIHLEVNEESHNDNQIEDDTNNTMVNNEPETHMETIVQQSDENNSIDNNDKNNYNNEPIAIEVKSETLNNIEEKITPTANNEEKNIDKLRKDLICELTEEHVMRQVKQRPGGRVGRPKPAFGPLVPQERPIVLPGGRKWKVPRDALTDSFIAETLSGQAELIMGKTLGNHFENIYSPNVERVNFMKYAKPPKTLDHLKNSSVFKMIHDMDEPPHGIYDRAPVVMAESEFREKCRSITPNTLNGNISVEAES